MGPALPGMCNVQRGGGAGCGVNLLSSIILIYNLDIRCPCCGLKSCLMII